MRLATTTVSTRATMLPAMPMQAMKNAVSRPGRRAGLRQRDVAKLPPRRGAEHLGGVVLPGIALAQRGAHDEHGLRQRIEHVRNQQAPKTIDFGPYAQHLAHDAVAPQ